MRYLVLDTEAEALDAVASIDGHARIVFASRGYTITAEGAIVGKRASDGEDVPTAVTTTWDVPRQRADGKWCVAHPESHPSASVEIAPGITVADFVMEGIEANIDEMLTGWWPPDAA
jgi:hypothetical protein